MPYLYVLLLIPYWPVLVDQERSLITAGMDLVHDMHPDAAQNFRPVWIQMEEELCTVEEYIAMSGEEQGRWHCYREQRIMEFPNLPAAQRKLPVNPYFLGIYLDSLGLDQLCNNGMLRTAPEEPPDACATVRAARSHSLRRSCSRITKSAYLSSN